MKRTIAALAALAVVGVASAQSSVMGTNTLGQTSSSGAYNAGVNVNSFSSPFTFGNTQWHTNQAAAVPAAFATPAVLGTCATAGWGVAAQAVGGGLSVAGKGGVDAGCDLQRDLQLMAGYGATKDEILKRMCAKAEIADAMKSSCDRAKTPAAPVSAMPAPWQAGG